MRKFHGTKVLGTFAPEERKFTGAKFPWKESSLNFRSRGAKVPQERKFHGAKVIGLFAPRERMCTERKFHGSESSLYGLLAPGNESAEERKGQLPHEVSIC